MVNVAGPVYGNGERARKTTAQRAGGSAHNLAAKKSRKRRMARVATCGATRANAKRRTSTRTMLVFESVMCTNCSGLSLASTDDMTAELDSDDGGGGGGSREANLALREMIV